MKNCWWGRVEIDEGRIAAVLQLRIELRSVLAHLERQVDFVGGRLDGPGEADDGIQVGSVDVVVAAFKQPVPAGNQLAECGIGGQHRHPLFDVPPDRVLQVLVQAAHHHLRAVLPLLGRHVLQGLFQRGDRAAGAVTPQHHLHSLDRIDALEDGDVEEFFGFLVRLDVDRQAVDGLGDFLRFADDLQVHPGGGDVVLLEEQGSHFAGRFDVGLFDQLPLVIGDVLQRGGTVDRQAEFELPAEQPGVEQLVVLLLFAQRVDEAVDGGERAVGRVQGSQFFERRTHGDSFRV